MDEPDMEDAQPGIEQDEITELGQEVVVKTVKYKSIYGMCSYDLVISACVWSIYSIALYDILLQTNRRFQGMRMMIVLQNQRCVFSIV